MARQTSYFTVTKKGRDQGKTFLLTEMSALQADRWATRALFAITKGEVIVPESVSGAGFAFLAEAGLKILLLAPLEMVKPLLDELMDCVQFVPNADNKSVVRSIHESDIEEAGTYADLRQQVFELISGFFQQGE